VGSFYCHAVLLLQTMYMRKHMMLGQSAARSAREMQPGSSSEGRRAALQRMRSLV
jgi:hypothetical protein